MNTNQITNIVTTVLQPLLALLVTRGWVTSNETESIGGALAILIVFLISHVWHSEPPSATPPTTTTPSSTAGTLSALLLIGALAVTFSTGCNTTPQRVAYQAAATTQVTVDTAMTVWGDYVAANHPGTNAEAKVAAAYEKYQASFAIVADAGAAYAATGGTNGTAQAALDVASGNAAQELADLENLIVSFGVKLQ